MDNKKTILVVAAALAVGLVAGLLGPKMFSSRPGGPAQQMPAENLPSQVPAVADNTLRINELKKLLEANPNNVDGLVQLGNAYFDNSQPKESISAYERALALKPGNPDVLTDLGIMYRTDGRPLEAVARFREAMRYSGSHPQSRLNLGIVLYYDLKDTAAAKDAFQDFLRIASSGPQADQVRQILASMDKPEDPGQR